ncbi:hypothetical protein [Marinifilum sp.]|uniref:hypothetical protein n=1 Tax=Marinifilum sp. TaxID=2033137 RepID=UPI003BA99007
MKMVQQHIKKIAITGLYIMSLLILNNILFTHQHVLPDGKIIVHAHPFHKTDNPPNKHHHSKSDFLVLQNISLLFFIGSLVVGFLTKIVSKESHDVQPLAYHHPLVIKKFGRAPPR